MRYRIYRDETRLEPRGVQAIVQKNDVVGWHVESGGDYYLFKDNELWQSADMSGLIRFLRQRNLMRVKHGVQYTVLVDGEWRKLDVVEFFLWLETLPDVLSGETLPTKRYQEIFQEALADADFGRKHGYLKGEIR